MTQAPRPLVAGNWKMNGLLAGLSEIALVRDAVAAGGAGRAQALLCPPVSLLAGAAALCAGTELAIGGQDCHAAASGAHTGDISAEMLADAGAGFVIVGHSERRSDHGETDSVVRAKAQAGLRAGLIVIVCVGETRAEREAGRAEAVVGAQLLGSLPLGAAGALAIAYEPVWAIGTGLTPTVGDIAAMHAFIRAQLVHLLPASGAGLRILYGGSVKPANAAELMAIANVDGALVGGASLTCKDFMGIAGVYR